MPDFFAKVPPPPLTGAKTYVYKKVKDLSIGIDVFVPEKNLSGGTANLLLYIHGGAMIGGTRAEYPRPLLRDFLGHGFIVATMDYRLLPEVSFVDALLTDIRDVEGWLREQLPKELDVTLGDVVVAGGSAGAHLALLTPKLWTQPPNAILSFYSPTNLHNLPAHPDEGPAQLTCSSEYLHQTFDFDKPLTHVPPPKPGEPFFSGRAILVVNLIRQGLFPEFYIRGIERSANDTIWALPEKGSVDLKEVEAFSPYHLASQIRYPPTYLIHGAKDEAFTPTHATEFHDRLQEQGIPTRVVIVPDVGHAFDIFADSGDDLHVKVIKPAVGWILGELQRN